MSKKKLENKLVIYQTKSGALELRGDLEKETVWATQSQMAKVFEVSPQNITLHLKNIYKDNELDIELTCKESLQVQKEGKREIERMVKIYNLDAMIAVGYRVNSVIGTNFRIWATKTLREHITKGYTINRKRVAQNYDAFMKAVFELIKEFASTWVSLDAYDKESLVLRC